MIEKAAFVNSQPDSIEQVIRDILTFRDQCRPLDFTVLASKIGFVANALTLVQKGKEPEVFNLTDSGIRALCNMLHIPYTLLKSLEPENQLRILADLFPKKIQTSKSWVQLKIMEDDKGVSWLRAMFIDRGKVFSDKDVFITLDEIGLAESAFKIDTYWYDTSVTAVRIKTKEPVMQVGAKRIPISLGMDLVNSEIREYSLELKGVVWFGELPMVVNKIFYPSVKGTMNKISDPKKVAYELTSFMDVINKAHRNDEVRRAFNALLEQPLSLSREIKLFYEKGALSNLDVLKIAQVFNIKLDNERESSRIMERDVYNIVEHMQHRGPISAQEFIETYSKFVAEFDTYTKRSNLEFGFNLLF